MFVRIVSFVARILFISFVSSSNLTLVYRLNKHTYYMDCVTFNAESALVWYTSNQNGMAVDYYIRNNTRYIQSELTYFKIDDWEKENSLNSKLRLGFVTDERWQDFKTYTTEYKPDRELNFVEVNDVQIEDPFDFEIPFSLRSNCENHLFLCSQHWTYWGKSHCFWIVIKGFGGAKSVIRKCKRSEIPTTNKAPTDPDCVKLLDVMFHEGQNGTEFGSSAKSWIHFMIQMKNTTISVIYNNKTFLSYENADSYEYKHIILNSRDKTITNNWKIHNYDYLKTTRLGTFPSSVNISKNYNGTSICLSAFVYMCTTCKLTLMAKYWNSPMLYDVAEETFQHNPKNTWSKIKFIFNVEDYPIKSLFTAYIETSNDNNEIGPFWAVDGIRECDGDEVRGSGIVTTASDAFCYLLEDQNERMFTNNPSDSQRSNRTLPNCNYGKFGRNCISCEVLLYSQGCLESAVCEESDKCYCSPGFEGYFCQKACTLGTFGYGCSDNCTHCSQNSCSNIDGYCFAGCEDGYTGAFCKKGTNIHDIKSSFTEKSISLTWLPPEGQPLENLQYKINLTHVDYLECRTFWKMKNVGREMNVVTSDLKIEIAELIPRSRYRLNITTYNSDEELGSKIVYVETAPSLDNIFDLKFPDISIPFVEDSNKIVIDISDINCEVAEYPVQYFLQINCTDFDCHEELYSKCYNHSLIRETVELKPFSNYTWLFAFAKDNCGEILKSTQSTFRSKPSYPGQITELKIYAFSKHRVSFRWSNPNPPNGLLERYAINMQRNKNLLNISLENIKCKLWPEMNCFDWIDNWIYGRSYNFELSAWNKGVATARIKNLSKYIIQTDLTPPTNLSLRYSDDNRHLYLQWTHPDLIIGETIYFKIYTNRATQFVVPVHDFNQTYYYTIKDTYPSKFLLQISITTNNNYNRSSNDLKGSVIVPPKIPLLSEKFKVKDFREDVVIIQIPSLLHIEGDESYLLIVVSCSSYDCPNIPYNRNLHDLLKKSNLSDYNSWIAKEIPQARLMEKGSEYNISTNSSTISEFIRGYEIVDRNLRGLENIFVSVLLINRYANYERSKIYTAYIANNFENSFGKEYIYVSIVFVIAGIIGLLVYRYRSQKKTSLLLRRALSKISAREDTDPSDYEPPIKNNIEHLILSEIVIDITTFSGSKIPMENFEKYAKDLICSKQLENEFNKTPKSQASPCTIGALLENKTKNRYANLLPYDHSIIKLTEIDNDPFSNYINANLIQGYKNLKGYIATQGPRKGTTTDFWRMIWEQNVVCVVMVTNCIENEKNKCYQYWPNNDCCLAAGNFKITHGYSVVFADYTERIMTVLNAHDKTEREVRHLHFTSWPDHGTPLYPQTLSPFIRVVNNIPQANSPMVVHCSAGVGRTGTIILIDLCLRMAQEEHAINVPGNLKEMRENRSNLVGNAEQYELVYMVLLDMLFAPVSVIQCDATFLTNISNILQNNEHVKLYTYLKDIAWQDELYQSARKDDTKIIQEKNRFSKVLADENFRVYLSPLEGTTYINAVYVDGFKTQKQFIATQHPMKNTLADFWRMIAETNCKMIISLEDIDLDDDTSCSYWPNELDTTMKPFEKIILEHKSTSDSHPAYDEINVNVKYKNINAVVTILHVKKWRKDLPHPNSKTLVMLWNELTRMTIGIEDVIVVVCRDGAYRCGIFLAECFLLDKIKLEHECDVCLATRVVRRSRPQFLKDIRQFKFLYQLAKTYYEEFEAYSNFN